jgi:hypothetical protein
MRNWLVQHCLSLGGICSYSMLRDNVSQISNLLLSKGKLAKFTKQLMLQQHLKK